MRSAILRLSKKIVVDANTNHNALQQLYKGVVNNIQQWQGVIELKNWQQIPSNYKNQINKENAEYGETVLRNFLRNKMPHTGNSNEAGNQLHFERLKVEVAQINELPDALTLHYFLISENLTLIDNVGNVLLLVKGDHESEVLLGKDITDVFTLDISEGYSISEYRSFKSEPK